MNICGLENFIIFIVKQKQGLKLDDLYLYMTETLKIFDVPYGGIVEFTKIVEELVDNRRLSMVEYILPDTNKKATLLIPIGSKIYITAKPNIDCFQIISEVK